jgi:hypothetical protein
MFIRDNRYLFKMTEAYHPGREEIFDRKAVTTVGLEYFGVV